MRARCGVSQIDSNRFCTTFSLRFEPTCAIDLSLPAIKDLVDDAHKRKGELIVIAASATKEDGTLEGTGPFGNCIEFFFKTHENYWSVLYDHNIEPTFWNPWLWKLQAYR
jgi:hypothetical protein